MRTADTTQSRRDAPHTQGVVRFGIQTKAFVFIFFALMLTIVVGMTGLAGMKSIRASSEHVTLGDVPILRSMQEALSALAIGSLASEKALDVDDPEAIAAITDAERIFRAASARFNMFMAAITWGSDSEAFMRSLNGANASQWAETGFAGTLRVPQGSPEIVQLAGRAALYYEGLTNHTVLALEHRKRYLTLLAGGETAEAEKEKDLSKNEIERARVFADHVEDNVRRVVQLTNAAVAESADGMRVTQDSVERTMVAVGALGALFLLLVGIVFVRRFVVTPIGSLVVAVEAISRGDLSQRISITTGDELEQLSARFNEMAKHLTEHTEELEREVARRTEELNSKVTALDELNRELDKNTKLLTRRDAELTAANEHLRELDTAKSEFLSVAAHQLRTPLSAVKWVLSVLLEEHTGALSPVQKSYILKGEESNNRMIRLVDDMLTVTRIESGKTEYNFYLLSLHDILANTVSDFQPRTKEKHIDLTYEGLPGRKSEIFVDPEKIRFVLENLFDNAIKYTPEGGKISVALKEEGADYLITISDSGIGIPENEQKHIFSKFFRATNAVKQVTDGSGLGLFVARAIVMRHGGALTFVSKPENGTTFTIRLHKSSENMDNDTEGAPASEKK